MSLLQKEPKIYGAIQSDNQIIFQGFCKRIYDTQKQEVEIFIDGNKITTINADKKIPKIEDIYEVFDTVGFCFEYKIPNQYVGEKHLLEFKTKDGEQLLNSPTHTLSKDNAKYNEFHFIHSLSLPISEQTKEIYYPSSIGFLAIEENLNDKDFINYLENLVEVFPNIDLYGFSFYKELNNNKIYKNIVIDKINDIQNSVNILIVNPLKSKYDKIIYDTYYSDLAIVAFSGIKLSNTEIKNIHIESVLNMYKKNLDLFGLNLELFDKYPNHLLLASLVLTKNSDKNFLNILLNSGTLKEWQFNMINIALKDIEFLKNMNFLRENINYLFGKKIK